MLTLIHVSNSKLNEVLSGNNSILLRENPDKQIEGLLAQEMIPYKLEACTMMETYDKDFNLLGRIPFVDGYDHNVPDIRKYDKLISLFNKYPEGHTRLQRGDNEEDIYFRWTNTTSGDRVFVLIYISRPVVHNLWMIPFLCYLILILIFTLVMRLRMSCQKDRIEYYHRSSMRVQSKIFDK
jgi:hypothetical protein